MSGSSSSGAPPTGVVQNSALSFVASAQPMQPPQVPGTLGDNNTEANQTDRLVPAGLKALYDAWSRVYPDQPNPLQVTTRLKYWLGGQDPLDYISMYWNPGKPEENIPPHWHYVSFGLSDLHGDGRVHPRAEGASPSGCGAELSLRLSAPPLWPAAPPLWPAALLQALARYVLTTGNKFCAGDHITWHRALDGCSESRVRHLLVAADPQLALVDTPHGTVHILQMVGCTGRELRAAQRGSGFEVLKIIGEDPNCGGPWLVTKVGRRRSAPGLRRRPRAATGPAPLAGVSARLRWIPCPIEQVSPPSPLSPGVEQQIKETLQRGLSSMADRPSPQGHMSTDSFNMGSIEKALPRVTEPMQCSWRSEDSIEYFEGVHLMLNPEGASLLPLAIDGRVSHDSHFTWRCGETAASVLPPSVGGALPTPTRPYAARGNWLQIMIPRELAQEMSPQVAPLARLADTDSESEEESPSPHHSPLPAPPTVPFSLSWPRHKLKISVLHDHDFL